MVAAADLHAFGLSRAQRTADPDIALAAFEQVVRVEHAEGQTDHGGDRRRVIQRFSKVSLRPSTSLPSCMPRQTIPTSGIEVASLPARGPVSAKQECRGVGQARQVVVLLLFGAVLEQQLARAERVGHAPVLIGSR
ncbi:hypothetical protein [Salinicola tamaricis]|uniref:hypothetical protein n=1 Tax=Salinicola tamaricis TaxID=1771309 RepID=UPI001F5D6B1E|nr:hypothetical protein [Salinicola tamaricis]